MSDVNQDFKTISFGGGNGKSGGILAAISSIIVLGVGLVVGSFLLMAGLVVGVGLLIAFLIWRFFFMRKMKKGAEEFMKQNGDLYQKMAGGEPQAKGSGAAKGSGPVIDGTYEEVTK